MKTTTPSDEIDRTIRLLADLQSLRGGTCRRCDAALCHHEALFNISTGFKSEPLCCSCLAAELERDPVQMRDELWSFIVHKPCHRAGWAWANREENFDPAELPACLWPFPKETSERFAGAKGIDNPSGFHESESWDAGSMSCGDLVLELRLRLRSMKSRQVLRVTATDSGAPEDIPAWCRLTGHTLLGAAHPQYWIQRKED